MRLNYAPSVERSGLRVKYLKPTHSRHFRARAVCCKCRIALYIAQSVSTIDQMLSFASTQNCKFQPQARDPATGKYYLFCSNACAAPGTLPGLPAGHNLGGGLGLGAGVNASSNTRSNPALSLCSVSVRSERGGELLNKLCTKHCKKKPRYSDGFIVHPYCGRTCANLAKGVGPANGSVPIPAHLGKTANSSGATNPFRTTASTSVTNPFKIVTPTNNKNPFGTTTLTNATNPFRNSTPTNVANTWTAASTNPRNRPTTGKRNTTNTQNNRSSVYRANSSATTCQTPGCTSPVYVGPNGVAGSYCTRTHKG